MDKEISKWQSLAAGDLPTKHLDLTSSDFDFRTVLTDFDFAGFVDMKTLTGEKSVEFDYYRDAHSAERSLAQTGRNYYGSLFFIQIEENSLQMEDYCLRDAQCQQTSMNLLRYLACELGLKFQWQAYSWYYDNHEHSVFQNGSEAEIRALFS